jgi:hypothetical protein
MTPSSSQQVEILVPLLLAVFTILITIVVHAVALGATLQFIRREYQLGRAGVLFWRDVAIVAGVVLLALIAHLLDMTIWAVLYEGCGEFGSLATAFYNSAMIYTTLSNSDVIMSGSLKLFGPLEAANGVLIFGVTTAVVFAVMQQLFQNRSNAGTAPGVRFVPESGHPRAQ